MLRPGGTKSPPLTEQPRVLSRTLAQGDRRPPKKPAVKPGFFVLRRFSKQGASACVVHPHSVSVQKWNLLVLLILVIQAAMLPLLIAFGTDQTLEDHPWLQWFSLWAEFVLWLDIFLQFFVQIKVPDGNHWTTSPKAIAKSYCKNEFLIDLCSLLPLRYWTSQLVHEVLVDHSVGRPVVVRCGVQLIGFHKMLRFTRIRRILESIRASAMQPAFLLFTYRGSRILRSCITIVFICHSMGCLWCTLAVCGEEDCTWFAELTVTKGGPDYSVGNLASMYTCAIYWAVFTLTGIGYGDIVPVLPIEYISATLCMFIGSLTWAWVTANIVSIVATMNQDGNEHLQSLDCINELAHRHHVSVTLCRRLREYFTRARAVKRGTFVSSLIDRLSPELKIDLVHAIHDSWLRKVWWLAKVPRRTEFFVDLTQNMSIRLHTPNELVPNSEELCVVQLGLCIHGGALKAKGEVYGEDMLLNNPALRRPFATLSLTFLQISVLSKDVLNQTTAKHADVQPYVRRAFCRLAVARGLLCRAELYRRQLRGRSCQSLRISDVMELDNTLFNATPDGAVEAHHRESEVTTLEGGDGEGNATLSSNTLRRPSTKTCDMRNSLASVRRLSKKSVRGSARVGANHSVTGTEIRDLVTSAEDLRSSLVERATALEANVDSLLRQAGRLRSL